MCSQASGQQTVLKKCGANYSWVLVLCHLCVIVPTHTLPCNFLMKGTVLLMLFLTYDGSCFLVVGFNENHLLLSHQMRYQQILLVTLRILHITPGIFLGFLSEIQEKCPLYYITNIMQFCKLSSWHNSQRISQFLWDVLHNLPPWNDAPWLQDYLLSQTPNFGNQW